MPLCLDSAMTFANLPALGIALLLWLAGAPVAAQAVAPSADGERVIVKFKRDAAIVREHAMARGNDRVATDATLESRAGALGARHGLRVRGTAALGERVQVVQAAGLTARALAARLAADPEVEYAEPDRRMVRRAVPNDPRFVTGGAGGPAVGQWYLRAPLGEAVAAIDAVSAWDTTLGAAAIVVAVLDTGVRFDHPDLAGKLLPGYDMVSDTAISNDGNGRDSDASDPGDWVTSVEKATPTFSRCDVTSSSWHGTQVAGIIGAATDNGVGMAGAGWNLRVLPVRVLGKCFGYTSDIVAGIRWAAGLSVPGLPLNPNPARVINLSLGGSGACSQSEREAIAEANAVGAVVVAAAGNTAGLAASSPADCPGAIGVAGLRHVGTKVGYSDVGPELSIAAPGGNCVNLSGACLYPILTTVDSGSQGPVGPTYTDSSRISVGTSFSAPLVSATAGLMLSAQPALTAAGVRAGLQATARPFPQSGVADEAGTGPVLACHAPNGVEQLQCYCSSSTCGAGMLDAGAAVLAAAGGRARIDVSPAAPVAGGSIAFSGAGSLVAPGRTIAAWAWSLVDGGGAATAFSGSTQSASATLPTVAAGTVVVRLVITDDRGVAIATQTSVSVAAPPGSTVVTPTAAAAGGGSGGGALSWGWLLALAAAAAALRRSASATRVAEAAADNLRP